MELYEHYLRHPGIAIDSRRVQPGDLFFALKGEHTDGNRYAKAALDAGASLAVIDDPAYDIPNGNTYLVEDALVALQALARHHRRQYAHPVVALTGSNGKTTTKELLREVLAQRYRVHATEGNYNNHIGVPLTLLRLPLDSDIAVIEMGANHQGEIDALCRIAEPSHGLITNVGQAHLEGFGGIEGVKRGKSELYRYLSEVGGTAFVNTDERELVPLLPQQLRKIKYAHADRPEQYQAKLLATSPTVRVSFSDHGVAHRATTRVSGQHNFQNVLTAIAVGQYFKVSGSSIAKALEQYTPRNNRSEVRRVGDNTFYLDAYNANPSSMTAALDHFDEVDADLKVVILGDMLELGGDADDLHRQILLRAKHTKTHIVVTVGPQFGRVQDEHGVHFEGVAGVRTWLDKMAFNDAHILLKGSRGIGLERILQT